MMLHAGCSMLDIQGEINQKTFLSLKNVQKPNLLPGIAAASASSIQHPASSIQHPVSSIQYPVSPITALINL
jgi:hypothetical protein